MPRTRTVHTEIFKFDELSDSAKERAREWYRGCAFDHDWYECTFDDAKTCLALAGFSVDKIYFSGFWSQGDGACFEGSWRACDAQPVKAMREHAPNSKELHKIAATMRGIARRRRNASMHVKQRGHYNHELCTDFSVECQSAAYDDGRRRSQAQWAVIDARDAAIETEIIEASRDAMRWIYRQLEQEYNYQTSDEQVDENIRANEYDFTEDGRRA